MQTSRKLPHGWEDYSPIGKRIENTPFVAFKVPLKPTTCKKLSKPENSFTVEDLLEREPRLGLVIDLTFTYYYDPEILCNRNVEYKKIFLRGRGELPSSNDFYRFFDTVKRFTEKSDKLIGVHCTHGVNRTGYMICRYMIEKLSFEPKKAVDAFEKARGHKIVREAYTEYLLRRMNNNRSEKNKKTKAPRTPKEPRSVENQFRSHSTKNKNRQDTSRHPYHHQYSYQANPNFMPFDESNYIPQVALNEYQRSYTSSNQNFGNFHGKNRYKKTYNSASQSNNVYGHQSNYFSYGREHLHSHQNNLRHQNFYAYQQH